MNGLEYGKKLSQWVMNMEFLLVLLDLDLQGVNQCHHGILDMAVNDYRTHLYYRIIDIISEVRFSDFNLTLLSAMQALLQIVL